MCARFSSPPSAAGALQGVFSPSKIDGGQVLSYENQLSSLSSNMYSSFNESLLAAYSGSQSGELRRHADRRGTEPQGATCVSSLGTC